MCYKEERDAGATDLTGVFLQTRDNQDKEPALIELNGEVYFLLVDITTNGRSTCSERVSSG